MMKYMSNFDDSPRQKEFLQASFEVLTKEYMNSSEQRIAEEELLNELRTIFKILSPNSEEIINFKRIYNMYIDNTIVKAFIGENTADIKKELQYLRELRLTYKEILFMIMIILESLKNPLIRGNAFDISL